MLSYLKKYSFEFLSIFIAVISAFALNNWNDNRRERHAEVKILKEINNGLIKDLDDIKLNVMGHEAGVKACKYWRTWASNDTINPDSALHYYFYLTRDFVCIQNSAGYESLKSKGLEIIHDDSLRLGIIALYEFEFNALKLLEEEYQENQFHSTFFHPINDILLPYFEFDEKGNISGIQLSPNLKKQDQKRLLTYLWKIQFNRRFMLSMYKQVEGKIEEMQELLGKSIK